MSSGIEEEDLVLFVDAIAEHGLKSPTTSFKILQGISKVSRIKIACAMLDKKASRTLQSVFLHLHPSKAAEVEQIDYDVQAWALVRESFGV
mmetsp:Transcript_39860/g.125224  ORF Transcript_39860/g.125224 Transcript_39860/m.125224 type:complete len:91 (+) Transcript_39860:706-978(+)